MDSSLLECIARWSTGEVGDQELLKQIELAQADVESHKVGFDRAVAELSPVQLEACRDLAEFAFDLIQALEAGLVDSVAAIANGDRSGVLSAGDEMARASLQLNHTFEVFRMEALVALGPTQIPNLNQLLALKREYQSGQSDLTGLLEELGVEIELAQTGLAQLDGEPEINDVVTLKNQFREHIKRLSSCAAELEAGSDKNLDAHLRRLETSYQLLKEIVPKTQMALRGHGPTSIPDLNHLLKLLNAILEGEVGDAPVMDALEGCEVSFSRTRTALETGLRNLDSALAGEEIKALLLALDQFEEGVGRVYDFLDERDLESLEKGRELLLQFGLEFGQRQENLRQLESRQGMLVCVHCSTLNPADRTRCQGCGFPLPRNIAATATSTFESREAPLEAPSVHSNLVKIYTLINQVAEGGPVDELLEEAGRLEAVLTRNLDRLPPEPQESDEDRARRVTELYDTLSDGADQMMEAFERLHTYAETGSNEDLEQAILLLDEGARLIARAAEDSQK